MTIPESGEISFSDFYRPVAPPTLTFGDGVTAGAPTVLAGVYSQLAFSPIAGKFVVIWKEDNTGRAVIGTVSGTTASFGTEAEWLPNAMSLNDGAIAWNPNDSSRFVIVFRDHSNSYYPTAVVGNVSGSAITFSTPVVIHNMTESRTELEIAFDPNVSGRFVLIWKMGSAQPTPYYSQAMVGTMSGNTLSFGTPVTFNQGSMGYPQLAFDPNNSGRFAIAYQDGTNSWHGAAIVGNISGNTISFGTPVVFQSDGNSYYHVIAFSGSNKFVCGCRNGGYVNRGDLYVGSISGTDTLSFSSATIFDGDNGYPFCLRFDPHNPQNFILVYKKSTTCKALSGQLVGSTLSYNDPVTFQTSTNPNWVWFDYDPNTENKMVVTYVPQTGTYDNMVRVKVGTLS